MPTESRDVAGEMSASGLLRTAGAISAGLVAGLLAILALGMLSGMVFPRERVIHVGLDAFASGELAYDAHRDEDYFTECSFLAMNYLRVEGLYRNAIETRFGMEAPHPCLDLESLVKTGRMPSGAVPVVGPYVSYPFGGRHLEALVLHVLDYGPAKSLYALLSYGSVLLLVYAMFRRSRSTALSLLPLGAYLLFGFSLHKFGHNLSHAPGFFAGFALLAAWLLGPPRLRDTTLRYAFFACLAVVVADFDLMHGSIPMVMSLAIMANHFFVVAPSVQRQARVTPLRFGIQAGREAVLIFAGFLLAYATVTLIRLWLLSGVMEDPWHEYTRKLSLRVADADSGVPIQLVEIGRKLWRSRFQLTPGGLGPSTFGVFLGLTGWILTVCLAPIAYVRRANGGGLVLVNVLVVALCTLGIVLWCLAFRQHTYIHVLFAIRLVALPAAYGCVAAVLLARFLVTQTIPSRWWVGSLAAASIASLVATAMFDTGDAIVTRARFSDMRDVDRVACAPLGLRSDSQPDGVVQISIDSAQMSPLALVGATPQASGPIPVRLERLGPYGMWHAAASSYVLGISASRRGDLLNRPDGTILLPAGTTTLWAHFCRDGHDLPTSGYVVYVGEGSVKVDK
jgi:hypothetical protein